MTESVFVARAAFGLFVTHLLPVPHLLFYCCSVPLLAETVRIQSASCVYYGWFVYSQCLRELVVEDCLLLSFVFIDVKMDHELTDTAV